MPETTSPPPTIAPTPADSRPRGLHRAFLIALITFSLGLAMYDAVELTRGGPEHVDARLTSLLIVLTIPLNLGSAFVRRPAIRWTMMGAVCALLAVSFWTMR